MAWVYESKKILLIYSIRSSISRMNNSCVAVVFITHIYFHVFTCCDITVRLLTYFFEIKSSQWQLWKMCQIGLGMTIKKQTIEILLIIIHCKFLRLLIRFVFLYYFSFLSYISPDYLIVNSTVRDTKEYLIIDRSNEDITISSKRNFFAYIDFSNKYSIKILCQVLMELHDDLSME